MTHTVGRLSVNNEKLIKLVLLSFTMFFVFSCVGCEKADKNNVDITTTETALRLLGTEKIDLVDMFDGLLNESAENPDLLVLSKKVRHNETDVDIEFELYNDRLFRIRYNFGEKADEAVSFVTESYSKIISKYGESDTYKSLPNRIEGIKADVYSNDDIYEREEYWIDTDVKFENMVPERYLNTKRIDLGLGISKVPDEPSKSIVYIGGIVNSVNTTQIAP